MSTTTLIRRTGMLLIILAWGCLPLPAQEGDSPGPVTTADPTIPVDRLQLLLEPLTKGDLEVEAKAWQGLLKAAVQDVSEAQLASKEATDQKAEAEAEAEADRADAEAEAEADKAEADKAEASKEKAVDAIAELQDSKTKIASRFTAVLDALEKKGGDPAEYRVYAAAVSGVKLDVADAEASASAIKGWILSDEGGIKWGLNILKFLGIMVAFWLLAAVVSKVVRSVVDRQKGISDLLKRFMGKMVRRLILLVGLIVALSTLGVNVGALLALIGGGAFIIGFALQDTLGNFAAGLILLIYRPFDVGDAVEVGGVTGKVDNVSLVSTTIKTFDNKVVLVPNKNVWGEVITNITGSTERRVDMVFGIGYDDDVDKAKEILERIVSDNELVLAEPEPVIQLNELADSSVNFICRPWAKTGDYWTVYWDITKRAKAEFDAAGISIPFPQRDVHVYQANSSD